MVPRLAAALLALAAGAAAQAPPSARWAFHAIGDPPVPSVDDEAWARDALDRFVLARIEQAGLRPAADAGARTWLRRVTFDLTGLPPAPDEMRAFLADPSPDARAKVVDRLLASPHYGERMARMWLDLVRYADSNGLDENLALAHAWRYRDYVVRAFAGHMPYDRFLLEQIAGDLLPQPEDEQQAFAAWTATGMLALGPKMLAEQDKQKLVMDVVDEQMDVLGRAVLGLTVGCARCHDHKYDPLPARDYYALAGVFASTSTLANLEHVSAWRERELALPEAIAARGEHVARVEALQKELDQRVAGAIAEQRQRMAGRAADYLLAAERARPGARWIEAEQASRTNLLADAKEYGDAKTTILRTHSAGRQSASWDLDLPQGGRWRLEVRYAAKESRPVTVTWNGAVVATAALAATTGGWKPDALRWHAAGELTAQPGRNELELARDGAFPHVDRLLLVALDGPDAACWPLAGDAPDGLQAGGVRRVLEWLHASEQRRLDWWQPWHAVARLPAAADAAAIEAALAPLRDTAKPESLLAALLAGPLPASRRELAARYQLLLQAAGARDEVKAALDPMHGLFAVPELELPAGVQAELEAGRAQLAGLRAATPPEFPRALAVKDGEPQDLKLHVRGSHLAQDGDPIPRGVPGFADHLLPRPQIPAGGSGRLELARWIVDPRHPLTARVIVNRIWLLHFGAGIVRTPSNFGLRGEPPTHPELLDHLSRGFVANGWSIQALQRRILLSRSYGLDSQPGAEAAARDPDNRLLSHQNRRRLEAEMVRDAMLAVAGTLDRSAGGSLLGLADRAYVTNDQSADAARYQSMRRTLYLPVIRNALYDLLTTFDFNDPSVHVEQRPATAIASQALFVLNSPLVHEQSQAFAARLMALPDDRARIAEAYWLAFSRPPAEQEIEGTLAFLAEAGAGAWPALAQVLLMTNEFLYID